MADFCAAYGYPAHKPLTYREFVQLYLNVERVRMQQAIAVSLGQQMAVSDEPVDLVWGDAVAMDPVEAAEIVFQANVQRMEARARRRTW